MLFSSLLDKYLGHRVVVSLTFKTLSNRMYHFRLLLAIYESSACSMFSLILSILGGVQQYLVIFTCVPEGSCVLFHVLTAISLSFVKHLSLLSSFYLVVSFINELQEFLIYWIQVICHMYVLGIIFPSL